MSQKWFVCVCDTWKDSVCQQGSVLTLRLSGTLEGGAKGSRDGGRWPRVKSSQCLCGLPWHWPGTSPYSAMLDCLVLLEPGNPGWLAAAP